MDFVRRIIIDHETVITKELLDAFQDGIIEAITKAEAALAIQPSVYNASTHDDFPPVGNTNVIYKAEKERQLYQWNAEKSKYEILCKDTFFDDVIEDVEENGVVTGGDADEPDDSSESTVIIHGGQAAGVGDMSGEVVIFDGGDAGGIGK